MPKGTKPKKWPHGSVPVAVVMISLNEAHNMEAILDNISGWAQEVFLVDSYSTDETVDIALSRGVHVVQRPFKGFGDQWNFAINELPIKAPWTMKLDPDERLTPELQASIGEAIQADNHNAFIVQVRLWFMGKILPARLRILRLWRTGKCQCSDVGVNEHMLVEGQQLLLKGDLEHHDSPNLHHWYEKQNSYTTAEAAAAFNNDDLSTTPRLLGSKLEQRMWLKQKYQYLPFRHILMFLYCYLGQGAWRAGKIGFIWAKLRADVYRMINYKTTEMKILGHDYKAPSTPRGTAHPDAVQYDAMKEKQ